MPQIAGVAFHCNEGDASHRRPTVVLVHGAGGTALHWPPQVRRLLGYRVCAVDLPGHGRSEGVGEQSIAAYARRLIAWADGLALSKAVWVGHSMGGAIVQHLALHYPDRVLALGLVGTGARLRVNPLILEGTAQAEAFRTTVETIVKWSFAPQTDARLRQLAAQRMAETRPSVLHGDFLACDRFDVREQVSAIACPTLVLCGAEDKMTPPRYAEYLAQQIPQSRLVVIPEAGHMVMLEQPEAVAQALRGFLDDLPDVA
ncbi:MAG TPA: alpha/beta hydrolase [Anaerolineae bacterium]|nr:alpha/beta hydrolase [Anaerolineae bacterium]HID83511.1 alpha/beta hydrolase [Anaerolineales bacterium]HIQ09269.1 alpha/beta hydrolase [Anaerolineaceae bacterium]